MLDEIIKNKLKEVSKLKSSFDVSKIDISAPKKPFYETLLFRQSNKKNSIIAEIKKRSPIWKKEHYKNEESEWLKGISLNN